MELPAEMFVGSPLKDDPELVPFRYGFLLEGKSVDDTTAPVVTENEDGDLIIDGWAAVFDGVDREGENFTDGAFQRGIKAFLGGQAGLCYHHKHDKLLGKVLELEEVEGKGLHMKARVDSSIQKHPELRVYYDQIKRGTLNGLSVFGAFRRKLTEFGRKIVDVDLAEISVTPVPIHPGTNFAVVAGKALVADISPPEEPKADDETEIREDDLRSINFLFEELDTLYRRIEEAVQKRDKDNSTVTI